tara:strand:+ start:736 stop:1116 length:381 start_codon:yes stop_codon:yes gene_type:complete
MRTAVLALAFLTAACASPGTEPGRKAAGTCANSVHAAMQSSREFALQRKERMKVMRFGSEAAMNAYLAETDRLTAEADRLETRLTLLRDQYNAVPNRGPVALDQLTAEDVEALIASADTCAAGFVQ